MSKQDNHFLSGRGVLHQSGPDGFHASPFVVLWLISVLISVLVFSFASSVDLSVSRWFFVDGIFPAAHSPTLHIIRMSIWALAVGVGMFCIFGMLAATFRPSFVNISLRLWGVTVAVFVLGPGLIVNGILKSFWGRARPANIAEFGGSAQFTPPLLPADQCASNCSFVSGEGAGAVAVAVAVWLLTRSLSSGSLRSILRGLAVAAAIVGSLLRVAAGRHFLSDIIFAALIVTGLALLFLWFTRRSDCGKLQ